MTTDWIDANEITPLHGVTHPNHLRELTRDMKKNGWQGRPLLVIKRSSDYLAWTGTHRLAAALAAELESVPCYVLPERKLLRHGFDAQRGHVEDHERLKILIKVGDEDAIQLMWLENRS